MWQRAGYNRVSATTFRRGQARRVIAELLARTEVELVHLRNAGCGCYNFAVRAFGADGDERTRGRERGS